MKIKSFMSAMLLLAFASAAFAGGTQRLARDIKLPTQKVLEYQAITNPVAAETNDVATAIAGATSAAAITVTAGLSNPDVPRNLVITPGTSTVDVGTCTITANGTNILGATISEDFAFAGNASSATTGSKAFKTVTSLAFAASCEDGNFAATWSVGVGEKIGLKRCLDAAGHLAFSTIDGALEATRGTMAISATAVESNTIDFNGTMDGASDFEVFFYQNYRCAP